MTMKKFYKKPAMKVRVIENEAILAASDPSTITVKPSDGTINDGRVDAKPSIWDTSESE